MPTQGNINQPGQKRLLLNWGGSFTGTCLGAIAGCIGLTNSINSLPGATLLGAVLGAVIGFGFPEIFRIFGHAPKAQ